MRTVAGLLQNRLAQTTAIRFEAKATSIVDNAENGGSRRHRATNAGGCYANHNADNPEGILHGVLLCDSASHIDAQNCVDDVRARLLSPRGTTQDSRTNPLQVCGRSHRWKKSRYSSQKLDGYFSQDDPT